MGSVYDRKAQKNLEAKKDFLALKPLLWNIKEEEPEVHKKIKSSLSKVDLNFKKSFMVISKQQVYKSYSITGLMLAHDRKTKYYVLDLSLLLDVWWNSSALINKSKLLDCDILIVHGVDSTWQANHKIESMLELISIRKTMSKITWVFIEQSSSVLNEAYNELIGALDNCHYSNY